MAVVLASSRYGKSAVRMLKVVRSGQRHDIRDLTVDVSLEGEFEEAHTSGDNSMVLPTDTMKNTVYAKARDGALGEPEEFALSLTRHFLVASRAATSVRVRVAEHAWGRIEIGGRSHDHAFQRGGNDSRTAEVMANRDGDPTVVAGIDDLLILKTARSAFAGYVKDAYTTLPETSDRILATSMSTQWRYGPGAASYGVLWSGVRRTLLETFANHESKSVQHTMYAMGEAVLDGCDDIEEISITMPNKHHLLADLTALGLTNRNEIFVPTDEPYGLIEATLRRHSGIAPQEHALSV